MCISAYLVHYVDLLGVPAVQCNINFSLLRVGVTLRSVCTEKNSTRRVQGCPFV